MSELGKTDAAWRDILRDDPRILRRIAQGEDVEITADTIKRYREPRLMTKHDTHDGVPKPLKENGINVLSISRKAYVLGTFAVHEDFPDTSGMKPLPRSLPEFETLTIDDITSESNAINALIVSGILDEFIGVEGTVETFNGRMGSGDFDFHVSRTDGGISNVRVHGAQIEIDGGFENDEAVIIMEAKNIRHDDFNVRQLYYPFRKYAAIVTKPIRLVFSQYTNLTYYLFEYEFAEVDDFSSITLVRKQAYTFEDVGISPDEMWDCCRNTVVKTNDDVDASDVPFPQADRFDRVLSLMERLSGESDGMTTDEVAEFMGVTTRQAAYYPAAGEYLGLFDRSTRGVTKLSEKGSTLVKMGYRNRVMELARLMFEHGIFSTLFTDIYLTGLLPGRERVKTVMREMNVCGASEVVINRRASTVISWLRWLTEQTG